METFSSPIHDQTSLKNQSMSSPEQAKYEDLLKSITELQNSLQDSAAFTKSLKEENESLKLQHQDVSATLLRTRTQNKETSETLTKQLQLTIEKEQTIATQITTWQTQIQNYKEKILRLETNQSSHSMQRTRLQIQKELELIYSSKYDKVDQEMNEMREKFFEATQKFEFCQVEFQQYKENIQQEKKSMELRHQEQLKTLRCDRLKLFHKEAQHIASTTTLYNKEFGYARDKVMETLHQQIEAHIITEKLLREENTTLCHKNEQIEKTLQTTSAGHQVEMTKMRSDFALLEITNKRLRSKVESLENQSHTLRVDIKDARKAQTDAENENNHLNIMLSEERKKWSESLQNSEACLERHKADFVLDKEDMNRKHEFLNQKLKSTSSELKKLQENAVANSRSIAIKDAKARSESNEKINALLNQKEDLKNKVHELENKLDWSEIEQKTMLEKVMKDRDELRQAISETSKDAELKTHSLLACQKTADSLRSQLLLTEKKVTKMEQDIDLFQKQAKDAEAHIAQLGSCNHKLKDQVGEGKKDVEIIKIETEKERKNQDLKVNELIKSIDDEKKKTKIFLKEEVSITIMRLLLAVK